MRVNFPNAKLHASTFEAFLEAVQPVIDQLPVVEGEIGDTWISGIASDPKKMAEYRVVSDTLTDCIKNGRLPNFFTMELYKGIIGNFPIIPL